MNTNQTHMITPILWKSMVVLCMICFAFLAWLQPTAGAGETKAGSYWKATKYVLHFCGDDDPADVQWKALPVEESADEQSWWLDLFLYDDGTFRLREVHNNCYWGFATEGTWKQGQNGRLDITSCRFLEQARRRDILQDMDVPWLEILEQDSPNGVGKAGMLNLGYLGGNVYFERAPMPSETERLEMADLSGEWTLVENHTDQIPQEGKEQDTFGALLFAEKSEGLLMLYTFQSFFYGDAVQAAGTADRWDHPLYAGLGDQRWLVSLFVNDEETGTDGILYVAMVDDNTLQLHQHLVQKGQKITRQQTFKRAELVPNSMNIQNIAAFRSYVLAK